VISVTATQAARDSSKVLDQVERGETVIITRDGIPVGRLTPDLRVSAERLKDALRYNLADKGFADDLEAAHADLRAAFTDEVGGLPGKWSLVPGLTVGLMLTGTQTSDCELIRTPPRVRARTRTRTAC
jgi:prevent-host-death family protein